MGNVIIVTGQSNGKGTGNALVTLLPNYTVINCAVGGSSILEWQKGEANYNNCLAEVLSALENGATLRGLFHAQGEHETNTKKRADQWKTLTRKFIKNFLAQISHKDLPVAFAQLGPVPDINRPYWEYLQRQQVKLSVENPEFKMVVTKDIRPYTPVNGLHWSPSHYSVIAKRVASTLNL
jgi:hypothetical protein